MTITNRSHTKWREADYPKMSYLPSVWKRVPSKLS